MDHPNVDYVNKLINWFLGDDRFAGWFLGESAFDHFSSAYQISFQNDNSRKTVKFPAEMIDEAASGDTFKVKKFRKQLEKVLIPNG